MLSLSGAGIVKGSPRSRKVVGQTDLPARADVVVIGGGVIGSMTALNLAERGASVALCEKGVIAGEASGRAAGLIEYQSIDPIKFGMVKRSIELWRNLENRVPSDLGMSKANILSVFDAKSELEHASDWARATESVPGISARMLTGEQLQNEHPDLGSEWAGGLVQEDSLSVEPALASSAVADAAMANGASILQNCAVREIQIKAGSVAGVVTERGSIEASNIVIAGGVWSPALIKPLGLELPQLMVFAEMLSVAPVSGGPEIPLVLPGGIVRREADGGYLLGCNSGVAPITPTLLKYLPKILAMSSGVEQGITPAFNLRTFCQQLNAHKSSSRDKPSSYERLRVFQPEYLGKCADQTLADVKKSLSAFDDCVVRERYTGALVSSIDNLGVVSPVEKIPGLYLGTGLLYGLTLSAAVGEALADLITGESPRFDLTPFRHSRFTDGTELKFYP
ncbi:MAG: FAD-binding oxidoreductase [Pseudomonadota bacterium]